MADQTTPKVGAPAAPDGAASAPAKPGAGDPPAPPRQTLTVWSFLAIAVVMAAFVTIVWRVLDKSTHDTSTAVFGVIVPVFATIGAAVFGIPIAYQRGNEAGSNQATATKQQEVAAAGKTATANAHLETQKKIQPIVDDLGTTVRSLLEQVRTVGESPGGVDALQFTGPSGTAQTIPTSALAACNQKLAELETTLRNLG